ncbi:MAG: hypothetical protein NTW96_24825 [Planctomycetia bacterium]|nr:hypothetical protein [Planctomycetia bacterium]
MAKSKKAGSGFNVRFRGAMPEPTATRTVENPDGMDPSMTIPASDLTPGENDWIRDFFANLYKLESMLEGITTLAASYREAVDKGIRKPDEDLGEAAYYLALEAEKLRELSPTADARAAALRGIKLGMLAMQFTDKVRFEPAVVRGKKEMVKPAKMHAGKTDKAQQRYAKIHHWVEDRLRNHPKDTLTYARDLAKSQFKVSIGVVKRATIGMKKPKR